MTRRSPDLQNPTFAARPSSPPELLAHDSIDVFDPLWAHKVRTQINTILGFAEMIKLDMLRADNPGKCSEYAANIHAATLELIELLRKIIQ